MITIDECRPQLMEYSVNVPDLVLGLFVERVNDYDLTTYSDNTQKLLGVFSVCYLAIANGQREVSGQGAAGANQSFKAKDSLKQIKDFIKSLDKNKLLSDLFVSSSNAGFIGGVCGYVPNR